VHYHSGNKIQYLHVRPPVHMDQHKRLPYICILEIYEYISKCLKLLKIGKSTGHFFKHIHFNVDVNKRKISVSNGSVINYTGQQRFCPRRNMSFSDIYFSTISLSHTLLLQVK